MTCHGAETTVRATLVALGQAAPTAAQTGHTKHHAAVPAETPSDLSIYNLEGDWLNQMGDAMPLSGLTGRVQLVTMVYTNCHFSCPMLVADMKRIEASLPADRRDQVGYVLISVDPKRDTPEQLHRFAESSLLDPSIWTLLAGSDDQILEVGAVLGVKVRKMPDGEFAHSNVITILNQAGEIVHRQVGVSQDPAPSLEVIRSLLN
jgi:protein SCO1/2